MVSPAVKWTAKSVSNPNGVTAQMAMWKRRAIFYEEKQALYFKFYAMGTLLRKGEPNHEAEHSDSKGHGIRP